MTDPEKDEDVIMSEQSSSEKQQIMDHISKVGQEMAANIQGIKHWLQRPNNAVVDSRYGSQVMGQQSYAQPNGMSSLPPNETRPLPPPPLGNEPVTAQLLTEREKLKDDLELSKAKCSSLEEELKVREERLREREAALQKSHADLRRLSTIIYKGAVPNAGPPDDYFRIEFCNIRDTILKIVRSYYQVRNVSLKHSRNDPPAVVESQRYWFANWNGCTPELRNYRAQGAIFEVLESCLFSKPVFAIDSKYIKPLSELESLIEDCPEISQADFVEWRRRTVAAAKSLKNNSTENVDRSVKKIFDRLEPALSTPRSKDEQLLREVRQLCDKAFQLALEMRLSKAIFKVVMPAFKTEITLEDTENDMVAVEGKGVSPSGAFRITYTVFGGLEKTALIPGENQQTIKLEKSQVVGFAP